MRPPRRGSKSELTFRERDIARLTASSLTVKQIAQTIGISEKTVKAHRSNISRKLGGGIARITLYAVKVGLVTP